MFHRISSIYLHTINHLDTTEALGGVEGEGDGEEVLRVAPDGKLERALFVVGIDERVLPEERAMPRIVRVFTIALSYIWCPHSVRNWDADDYVLKFEVQIFQFILYVDIASAGAVIAGPAVDRERNVRFLAGSEPPLQNSDSSVQREWLRRVLQADDRLRPEEVLVDVRVGL